MYSNDRLQTNESTLRNALHQENPETSAESTRPPPDYTRTITKKEINELPLVRYHGTIHLVTTPEATEAAVNALSQERVLGFDTESRPSFRKGESYLPSLVQFAGSNAVYLFQINRIGGIEGLNPILTNPDIAKAGVALHDDIKKLQEISMFEDKGFVEISELTKQLGVANTGLRSLTALFLQWRISKGAQVSNWARQSLNNNQIIYAATDAWISRELFCHVEAIQTQRS